MKTPIKYVWIIVLALFGTLSVSAQYGYGSGYGYGNRYGYGRSRSAIPQTQVEPKKEDPLTPEEIVEQEMPNIVEQVNLNEFESAVVSSILIKYLKKRQEILLLELEPNKTREALEAIYKGQETELKQGLPEDKYEAFVKLQEDGFKKSKKKKKKKKKEKS